MPSLERYYYVTTVASEPPSTTYAEEVLADNPLFYWRLNSASTQTDAGSAGVNLSTVGSPTQIDGPHGASVQALTFDGSTQYCTAAHDASMNLGTSDYTLEFFFKHGTWSTTATEVVMGHDGNGGLGTWEARIQSYGRLGGRIIPATGSSGELSPDTGTLDAYDDDNWHLADLVYDRSGFARLYVDGSEVSDAALPDDISVTDGNAVDATKTFYLARRETTLYYTGGLAEVAVYLSALSPTRISAHWAKVGSV